MISNCVGEPKKGALRWRHSAVPVSREADLLDGTLAHEREQSSGQPRFGFGFGVCITS